LLVLGLIEGDELDYLKRFIYWDVWFKRACWVILSSSSNFLPSISSTCL